MDYKETFVHTSFHEFALYLFICFDAGCGKINLVKIYTHRTWLTLNKLEDGT